MQKHRKVEETRVVKVLVMKACDFCDRDITGEPGEHLLARETAVSAKLLRREEYDICDECWRTVIAEAALRPPRAEEW